MWGGQKLTRDRSPMATLSPLTLVLAVGALLALASTLPFTATAIEYRGRDNGLAFLLLVAGVGVWNAMVLAQLLTADPLVSVFFLALSVVGAVLTGLGWFLFATTASGTGSGLHRSDVYAVVGVLGGLDIALATTAPVHAVYWTPVASPAGTLGFAVIAPAVGYWLHTALLAGLFGTGALLFGAAWRDGTNVTYSRAYALAGGATTLAVVGSNVLTPGGQSVAPLAAAALAAVGWVQASRGRVLGRLRSVLG